MAVGLPGGSLKHPISALLSNTKRWGLPAKNSFASDGTKEMLGASWGLPKTSNNVTKVLYLRVPSLLDV